MKRRLLVGLVYWCFLAPVILLGAAYMGAAPAVVSTRFWPVDDRPFAVELVVSGLYLSSVIVGGFGIWWIWKKLHKSPPD